ncbi:MAG TPA: UvrD-helicase domain-containing protein [Candidatus Woesebacteria bacterium]|nr:UvrD-helicase domain-containing protein [Candidatus Woesebacteria bacterium]
MSSVDEFLQSLNPHQQEAVKHQAGPAVVLAGAGSGKTRVLTTHAAWLIQNQNVQPDQILLVTFTNKAAGEMNQRIQYLTNTSLPFSGTFHSFCARLLRIEGTAIGLNQRYLIFDSNDQLTLMKQIFKDRRIDPQRYKPASVRAAISMAKNNLVDVDLFAEQAQDEYQEQIAKIYREYQHKLLIQNAVDFDDLLINAVTLLLHHSSILEKYQNQFAHVLIDEYQDTNKAQYQLTKLLAAPQQNIFAVGDFSQSIYAWRGADYRNLFFLKQDFGKIKEYLLEQNYRSTQPILSVATHLISANTSHPVLKLWTEKQSSQPIQIVHASSGETEAQFVIEQVKKLQTEYPLSEMAVLYRTNAQSRIFEEYLVQAKLPYQIIGGFKFYERTEVKDLLAYLRVAVNPLDLVSLQRLEKLGKRKLLNFQHWLATEHPQHNLELLTPHELLTQILHLTHYLERFDSKDPEETQRIDNINELLSVANQFSDIFTFLENVSLVQDEQLLDLPLTDSHEKLSLMSLHSAKGLEFSVVFIVGLEEGLLPHSLSLFDAQQLEEERRLCYVGITRAKERLYLSHAHYRWLYRRSAQAKPSRFLAQIPLNECQEIEYEYLEDLKAWPSRLAIKTKNKQSRFIYSHRNSSLHNPPSSQIQQFRLDPNNQDLDQLLNNELDIDDFLRRS